MALSFLIAGFTLGAAGSLHCIGMCGPLSLALPTYHLSGPGKFFSLLLYQLGRVITYAALGLIIGLAGRGIYLAGYQKWFSITAGCIMLLTAFFYFTQKQRFRIPLINFFYNSVQSGIGNLLKKRTGPAVFLLLGMANGLLPCGMVYMAVMVSLTLTGPFQSIAFMAMFGAGTLPAMLLFAYSGHIIKPGLRNLFRRSVPFFISAMGAILILRGLQLGIPFLSPQLPGIPGQVISCGH